MRRMIPAILALAVVVSGCKVKELADKANIAKDLDKRGTVDLMKQVADDKYDPPKDGRLTESQVQMYLKVREHEKVIAKVALQKAGLSLDYIDLIEVNEAFAAQYLGVEKELGLDREKVNVNGGAIALGHPLGATGARLVITLLYELHRRKKKYGLATACIGGGQGIAMIVESMS